MTWMSVIQSVDAAVVFVQVSSATCNLASSPFLLVMDGDASNGTLTVLVS